MNTFSDHDSDITATIVTALRSQPDHAAQLLESHFRLPMIRYCTGFLNSFDAEDAWQEISLKVIHAVNLPEANKFRVWIYRVARNHCLNLLRRKNLNGSDAPSPSLSQVIRQQTGPLTRLVRIEQANSVSDAILNLEPHYREVLQLRYGEGLSRSDIAEVLEISENVVKSRIQDGLKQLRRQTGHESL